MITKIINFSIIKNSMLIIMEKGNYESDYYENCEKETLKMDYHDQKGEQNIIHCNVKGCI